MVLALSIGMALTIAAPGLSGDERAKYELARRQAGRDPEAHVKLALWCEAHGLKAERMKHLAIAVLNDPQNVMARGLMGLVHHDGQWQRPEAVSERFTNDKGLADLLAAYRAKRNGAALTGDDQWALGNWCEKNGLDQEAKAHFRAVILVDPRREAAWKKLGYKPFAGHWALPEQITANKEERQRQANADRHWKPSLEKWRRQLSDKKRKVEAEHALAQIVDPRAVPMVWQVFAASGTDRQLIAVQLLGQIDAIPATRALAMLAVFSEVASVRRAAAEALPQRDVREFGGLLVALVQDPIKFEVRRVKGPNSPGELFVQGKKVQLRRIYTPAQTRDVEQLPGDRVVYDGVGNPYLRRDTGVGGFAFRYPYEQPFTGPATTSSTLRQQQQLLEFTSRLPLASGVQQFGQSSLKNYDAGWSNYSLFNDPYYQASLPSLTMQPAVPREELTFKNEFYLDIPVGLTPDESLKSAMASQDQLEADVKTLDAYNSEIYKANERVLPLLRAAAGRDLGEELRDWQVWWKDVLGYRATPQKSVAARVVVEQVRSSYQPEPLASTLTQATVMLPRGCPRGVSCFAAGTLVRTREGIRPIESLSIGDIVLTLNTTTGALGFHPVVCVHRNPPSETYRITLGKETIVSSAFHRFWVAGKGWVMARSLKPGDVLRTLGSLGKVDTIQHGRVEPVFNLDVAEDNDFFVGQTGALVHDNSLPDLRLAPFDATPVLAASTRGSK